MLDVSFSDINNGAIVGVDLILRTTNGGETWISKTGETLRNLRGVSLTDANNGWVIGWYGTILKTTNGGEIWIPQSSGTTTRLTSVVFTDDNNGTVIGSDYDASNFNGIILKTSNGGSTGVHK